jgi:hypothetical protein
MRRSDRERKRLAVASALRNANRLLNLSDNALIEEGSVHALARERYPGLVMNEEMALSDEILASAKAVHECISRDARLNREAVVLAIVLEKGSVQAAARTLRLSREHVSNTLWRTVTGWVLDEFERRVGRSRNVETTG